MTSLGFKLYVLGVTLWWRRSTAEKIGRNTIYIYIYIYAFYVQVVWVLIKLSVIYCKEQTISKSPTNRFKPSGFFMYHQV
jgi:hypothetical protein